MNIKWVEALYCEQQRQLYGPAGGLAALGFLFDEAVEKWTEDEGQDHTAAEDHHLFLEYSRDTDTEKNMCYIPLSHKFGSQVKSS